MRTRSGKSIAQIDLSGHGHVEITFDVDLFRLTDEDRAFIGQIVTLAHDHQRAKQAAQRAKQAAQRAPREGA